MKIDFLNIRAIILLHLTFQRFIIKGEKEEGMRHGKRQASFYDPLRSLVCHLAGFRQLDL